MKFISAQFALQGVYFLLFFTSFGLWHYFQDYSDYLLISFQWYPAACSQLNASKKGSCNTGLNNPSWKIQHFQSYKEGGVRNYCDNRYPYIDDVIQADHKLTDQLGKYWPSLHNGTTNDHIWRHEYVKYGSCMGERRSLQSHREYFTWAVDLYEQYDLQKILSDGKITPSKISYKLSDIKETIEATTKTTVRFQCFQSQGKTPQILARVLVCTQPYNHKKLQNCGDKVSSHLMRTPPNTGWDTSYPDELNQVNRKLHSCTGSHVIYA